MAQRTPPSGPIRAVVAAPGRFASRATGARDGVLPPLAFRLRSTAIRDGVD